MFSFITKKRIENFKSIKRGYYSLIIITILFTLSLFSEFIANDKPLIMQYNGNLYFPFLKFYPEKEFIGEYHTEANYKQLFDNPDFKKGLSFVLNAPIPFGPNESISNLPTPPPSKPSLRNLLGTDDRGRDLLTRIIYGLRISMCFALTILFITIILGTIIGGIQGYLGGKLDIILQRLIEIVVVMPFLYIIILLSTIFKPGFSLLIFVWSMFCWIGISYYIRAEVLRARKMEYVTAAYAIGAKTPYIIIRHIIPNILTPIITFAPFSISSAIVGLTSLDYLGFGVPAPTASWGELISQGLSNISSWWLSLFPIMALFFTLLLINFIGEAVREAFDPRQN